MLCTTHILLAVRVCIITFVIVYLCKLFSLVIIYYMINYLHIYCSYNCRVGQHFVCALLYSYRLSNCQM